MFIKCSLNQRRKILPRKVVIRLCSSICLSLNLLRWCRASDRQRETEWTHVALVPSFVDSRETSHIASLQVKGSVCLSCISRRSLFHWIRSPVPCLGLSLQPPSASSFSPGMSSQIYRRRVDCMLSSVSSEMQPPHIQALENDAPRGGLHLGDWLSRSQKLPKWNGIESLRGSKVAFLTGSSVLWCLAFSDSLIQS